MSWLIITVLACAIVSTVYHYIEHGDPIIPTFIIYILWIAGTFALLYFIIWLIGLIGGIK